jgi:hypothetical protein
MVFDAHNRAFAFFKGACTRGIYDNMKTAVETVFIGARWSRGAHLFPIFDPGYVYPVSDPIDDVIDHQTNW